MCQNTCSIRQRVRLFSLSGAIRSSLSGCPRFPFSCIRSFRFLFRLFNSVCGSSPIYALSAYKFLSPLSTSPAPFRLSCTDAASRCVSLSACFPHQLSYDPCTRNAFRCFSSTTVSPCPSAQASASSVPPPSRPQVTTRPLPAPPVLSLP